MKLTHINLKNFRNIEELRFAPHDGVNLITGPNGSGKTSLLEAVFYGCTSKSFRGGSEQVMKRSGAEYCRIELTGEVQGEVVKVEVAWGDRDPKQIKVDGVKLSRVADLFNYFRVVCFMPEDVELIFGSPTQRRRLLDLYLSQSNRSYLSDLLTYYKALSQRNAFLKSFMIDEETESELEMLDVWDQQLSVAGASIIRRRGMFVDQLKGKIQENYSSIEKQNSRLVWDYDSPFSIDSNIEESFRQKLAGSRRRDLYVGSTSAGPHRDDLEILLNGRLMNEYASQGEAKSAALAIKLSIFDYLSSKLRETPILLLDEFSSDLDSRRLEALLAMLPQFGQVFMTTAKESEFKRIVPVNAEIKLDQGRLSDR